MSDHQDNRAALPHGYRFLINNGTAGLAVLIGEVIGRGGSCIVYRGTRTVAVNGADVENSVIIKEFYPARLSITRQPDMSLKIQNADACDTLKTHFAKGQAEHARYYEDYPDLALPRVFFCGEANNTMYTVSDPGKGGTLSGIDFNTLSLSRISSIMESICSAIWKIHEQGRLYLDCKPDNFFCYGSGSDLQMKVCLFDFDTVASIKDIRSRNYDFCSASSGWVPREQQLTVDPITGIYDYREPESIGYQTDIYSIGLIFFWLLTGKEPEQHFLDQIENGIFDWKKESHFLKNADPDVIREVQSILKDSLEPDPGKRKYRHRRSIIDVRKLYATLYGLTAGDNAHFEPVHSAIGRMEENMSADMSRIGSDVQGVRNDVNAARESIGESIDGARGSIDAAKESIEQTVQRNSIKEVLFGTKKRAAVTIAVFLAAAVVFGVVGALSGRGVDQIATAVSESAEIEEDMEEHVLLKLSNANHQYETGLENWRRLDYTRAERDILAARDEISEEVSQAEVEVAKVNNSLGCLYLDMGRYADAYDYLNSAYVTFRDGYGEASLESRAVRLSIARYYYSIGNPEEALTEIQYILDHSDEETERAVVAGAAHLQASIYDAQGKYSDALSLYRQVLEMYSDISEDGELSEQLANYANDPELSDNEKDYYTNSIRWIVLTYSNISETDIHMEDYDSAISAANTGLELSLSNVYIGKRNITTSKLYMNLAIAQGRNGDVRTALDNIDLAMRIQRNLFDFEDVFPGLVKVYDAYGDLLVLNGDNAEAEEYYVNAVHLAEDSFGENHPDTADALASLGTFCYREGEMEQSEKNLSEAIEIRKNILAENHPVTARFYYDLAVTQMAAGENAEAKENLLSAREICDEWDITGSLREDVEEALQLI